MYFRKICATAASAVVVASVVSLTGQAHASTAHNGSSASSKSGKPAAGVPQAKAAPSQTELRSTSTNKLPAGCYGQTDVPHPSHHVGGTVNVTARTVCPGYTDYVSVALYRSRWYGWQVRGTGSQTKYAKAQANAADNGCGGVHNYLASSYHQNSAGAYAYTSNSASSLPCYRT